MIYSKEKYIFCHHADEIITKKDAEMVKKAIEKENIYVIPLCEN